MYAERTFLFSENKAHFRFFYETQDVKVIFLRNTGSKFYETQDIIELLYKDFRNIIKTASGFFWFFEGKIKLLQIRNCYK